MARAGFSTASRLQRLGHRRRRSHRLRILRNIHESAIWHDLLAAATWRLRLRRWPKWRSSSTRRTRPTRMLNEQAAQFFIGKSAMHAGGTGRRLGHPQGVLRRYGQGCGPGQGDLVQAGLTGKATAPKEAAGNAEVKKAVAADPKAIGYIDKSAVDATGQGGLCTGAVPAAPSAHTMPAPATACRGRHAMHLECTMSIKVGSGHCPSSPAVIFGLGAGASANIATGALWFDPHHRRRLSGTRHPKALIARTSTP